MNHSKINGNPFSSGSMIREPQRFIGRRRELEQIMTRLNGAQHEGTSIVGPRRIGKSSLLHYVYSPRINETLRPQESLLVIYLDAADGACQTPDRFRATLVKKILDEYKPTRRSHEGRWLAELGDQLSRREFFSWAETRFAIEKVPFHPVICLDEFESLITLAFDIRFFTSLRSWQNDGLLTWITAASRPLNALGMEHAEMHGAKSSQSSPFFNLLATVKLDGFIDQEISELLDFADNSVHPLTVNEKNKIERLAGNHPFHLQIVAEQVWNYKETNIAIDWKDLHAYLCQQPEPPDNCKRWWHQIKQVELIWYLLCVLIITLIITLYLFIPTVRNGLEDLRKWIGVIWNWLGAFGDGLGGLIIVIILIGIIGGGIWKRRRISAILLDLWEQIK